MNTTTRPQREAVGVEVAVLDLSQFEADVTAEVREALRKQKASRSKPDPKHDPETVEAYLSFGPYGLIERDDGAVAIVCTEGVAWDVDPEDGVTLSLHAKYGGGSRSMMPQWESPVALDYLRQQVTGETVDLAHFVRQFGQRLDNNVRTLTRWANAG